MINISLKATEIKKCIYEISGECKIVGANNCIKVEMVQILKDLYSVDNGATLEEAFEMFLKGEEND